MAMVSKDKVSLLIVALLSIMIFVGYQIKPVTINASWADSQSNVLEAYKNSDLVLIANVSSSKSYKLYESVFTNYKIDVLDTFKGADKFSPDKIEVRLNGGNLVLKEYRVKGQKMLEQNGTYLFLLKKVWPNNPDSQEYTPIGGFQGIVSLANDNGKFVGQDFNDLNRLEKELKGKDLTLRFSSIHKE